jgi:hypothetical protein
MQTESFNLNDINNEPLEVQLEVLMKALQTKPTGVLLKIAKQRLRDEVALLTSPAQAAK